MKIPMKFTLVSYFMGISLSFAAVLQLKIPMNNERKSTFMGILLLSSAFS